MQKLGAILMVFLSNLPAVDDQSTVDDPKEPGLPTG